MPLAFHAVRIARQHPVWRICSGQGEGFRREIRVARQERIHRILVFRAVHCAGGIDHASAGTKHFRRAVEDLRLPLGASGGAFGRPFRACFRMTAEHAFARTGCVHLNRVECLRPALRQLVGIGADDEGVRDAHALDILREDFRALPNGLIAHQHALSAHAQAALRRFSARRGAQVQYMLPRLRVQHGGGQHRARLLQVPRARFMQHVRAGGRGQCEVMPVFIPRDSFAAVLRQPRRALPRIHAQTALIWLVICTQKGGHFAFQLCRHLG